MDLFEQIVQAVNEELGISDLVTKTANNIFSMIAKDKKGKPLIGNKKTGSIKGVNLFGKAIDINYKLYFVDTNEEAKSLPIKWSGGYDDDNKALNTTVVYVRDENRYIDYGGTLQHEIEHAYQTSKHGKNLLTKTSSKKIYNAAHRLTNSRDYFEQVVGYSVYYANKFERDAHENSYYRVIMDNPSEDPFEIIKGTSVYKNLMIINNQLNNDTPYFIQSVENICMTNFGKHFNWWKNLTKRMINDYLTKIGKVIVKAKKDRDGELVDPNTVISQPPQFIKEENE